MVGAVRAEELDQGRLYIDLGFRDHEGLVAAYLAPLEQGFALVETGPSTCRDRLMSGLGAAGVTPEEVRQVILTHIHLDHAGGAGALAEKLPRAEFWVHRAGLPHLVDPRRLIASARRAWGPAADPLWGPILPLPAGRVRALDGGETLAVRGGWLRILATPGHAGHHVSVLDEPVRTLLTGDSAGVRLPGSLSARPALPPPELDIGQLLESLELMAQADPQRLFYTHFGPSDEGAEALRAHGRAVQRWANAGLAAARENAEVEHVAHALAREESRRIAELGGDPSSDAEELVSAYTMAAQGLLRYYRTRGDIVP